MGNRLFLTIDTEVTWRHHAAALDAATVVQRSLEPAGVGLTFQLERLAACGLKACFFVDPMPALVYGLEPIKRVVGAVLDAGQEVQLHLHPNWTGACVGDRGASHSRFEMAEYSRDEQQSLIAAARDLLMAAGAPKPVAFRAGSYGANDDTIDALAALGFAYDSSHNGAHHPWPSTIGLPQRQIAPLAYRGLTEVPVTLIEDRAGRLRNFQICALSAGEIECALNHALCEGHAAVTIVSHSFELANRSGTRANLVHVRRFEALCAMLQAAQAGLVTSHFADHPQLALGRDDRPLGPSLLRTGRRHAEQLWSNLIAERAA